MISPLSQLATLLCHCFVAGHPPPPSKTNPHNTNIDTRYGDMQLCAEAYHVMKVYLEMTPKEMAAVFAEWNKGGVVYS